jgi:hypothetical protein
LLEFLAIQQMGTQVAIGAGAVLAAHPHNLLILAAVNLNAEIGPGYGRTAAPKNIGKLGKTQRP